MHTHFPSYFQPRHSDKERENFLQTKSEKKEKKMREKVVEIKVES